MNDLDAGLAFKLWDLANVAVGFCVAQAMSFIYKSADKDFSNKLRKNRVISLFTMVLSLIGFIIYIMIIWGSQLGYEMLYKSNGNIDSIWYIATWARTIIVILFTFFSWRILSMVLKSK